jgi:hypothetical protein
MTGFPYPPDESYPNDTAHQTYQDTWNTRVIASPESDSSSQNGSASVLLPLLLISAAVALSFNRLRGLLLSKGAK